MWPFGRFENGRDRLKRRSNQIKTSMFKKTQSVENAPAAARTLAHRRKTQNWLALCLLFSMALNAGVGVYCWQLWNQKPKVVIFDLHSGTLLLSPLVDPLSSRDIIDVEGSWMASCLLDRTAAGLEHERLLDLLFDLASAKKAKEEFGTLKNQYQAKGLESHFKVERVEAQTVGPASTLILVTGTQVTTGVVDGQLTTQRVPMGIEFTAVPNPDLARNRQYPLSVAGYRYVEQKSASR